MKTELFTLCDAAQEYMSKCVIMGTFNEIKSGAYPTAIQNISLVIRIAFEPDETVKSDIHISACNVSEPEFRIIDLTFPFNNQTANNPQRTFANAILKLDGLQIPKPGTYRFQIEIGDWQDNIELYANSI